MIDLKNGKSPSKGIDNISSCARFARIVKENQA